MILNRVTLCGILLLTLCPPAFSTERCSQWAARLESQEGSVLWRENPSHPWQISTTDTIFCYGDTLRVTQGRAALRLENQTLVRLNADSTVRLLPPERSFFFQLIDGAVHFFSQTPRKLNVKAPYLNAAIDGTEFFMSASSDSTQIAVIEGVVNVHSGHNELRLNAGDRAVGSSGQRLTTAAGEATGMAAWTLNYPPVVIAENLPQAVRTALRSNGPLAALELILEAKPSSRTANMSALAAALALEQGNVDLAQNLIRDTLQHDQGHAQSLALRALIELVLGNITEAQAQLQMLLRDNPNNATVHMVQSYNLQSTGHLRQALAAAERALALAPDNAQAFARSAELHLAMGDKHRARQAVEQALQRDRVTAKIHTLAGFIELNHFATQKARAQFDKALLLGGDSAQAHFGLGLAHIQDNQLQRGREHLELAVLLDPKNSLLRSYLGKSYTEQRHLALADAQYQLAQDIDNNDPTPWFYEAQSKQLANEIPQSLRLMQTAIEKNNNRGVYRSQRLLDSDAAARSAGQSLLYHELGLTTHATTNATAAIAQSPTDFAGHRALALALASEPRQQTARTNEALLTRILQPLGATPMPPGFAANSLQVVPFVGPHRLGLNEYNALFSKKGLAGVASITAGPDNLSTLSWQGHWVAKKTAFTFGQYRYKDDFYFGDDNERYSVLEAEGQYQLTDTLNLQAHWRERDSTQFSPPAEEGGETVDDQALERDSSLRARFTPSLRHTLLLDLMRRRLQNELVASATFSDGRKTTVERSPELEHIKLDVTYLMTLNSGWLSVGVVDVDTDKHEHFALKYDPDPLDYSDSLTRHAKAGHSKIRVHTGIDVRESVQLQLGMEKLSTKDIEPVDATLPSAALSWTATKRLTFATVYWEDTELPRLPYLAQASFAGFNRFTDQLQWARSQTSAVRLKHVTDHFTTDVELRSTNVTAPRRLVSSEDRIWHTFDVESVRAAIFANRWTSFTLSVDALWEEGERRSVAGAATELESLNRLITSKLPITLSYFPSANLRLSVEATAVRQKAYYLEDGWTRDNFENINLTARWHSPMTPLSISLRLLNAAGDDTDYMAGGITTEGNDFSVGFTEFAHERTLLGNITLRF